VANRCAPFPDKFSILSALLKHPESDDAKNLLRELEKIFDLRNRLAHFKDEDTPIAGTIEFENFNPDRYPDAELIGQLRCCGCL
jgi:hypothetical protein